MRFLKNIYNMCSIACIQKNHILSQIIWGQSNFLDVTNFYYLTRRLTTSLIDVVLHDRVLVARYYNIAYKSASFVVHKTRTCGALLSVFSHCSFDGRVRWALLLVNS